MCVCVYVCVFERERDRERERGRDVRKKEEEREFLKQQTISVDEDISLLVKLKLDFFAPQIVYDSGSKFTKLLKTNS